MYQSPITVRKLILMNHQSPGDIVMLTSTVRDLHMTYPNEFLTDVRTPCPELWENNPWITSISDLDPDAEIINCSYPLIHTSNSAPYHFIHGFTHFLNEELKLNIRPHLFQGDIHLREEEQNWIPQIQELVGQDIPYWIINAGGKYDYTIKWWSTERYQQVIDHFKGKIQFVQIGQEGHHHPPLDGTINLIGKTDLRQLVRLIYHASGVLTPVSLVMHLAPAVPCRPDRSKNRPCVVISGGREPVHWEAYPSHQFIHTIGALSCCETGGCWRSRTLPLDDGDQKDSPSSLCLDVVGELPKCMDMITADEVIRRIEMYYHDGVNQYSSFSFEKSDHSA